MAHDELQEWLLPLEQQANRNRNHVLTNPMMLKSLSIIALEIGRQTKTESAVEITVCLHFLGLQCKILTDAIQN